MDGPMKRLSPEEINSFFTEHFAQVAPDYVIEAAGDMGARVRQRFSERRLRPGGTVSGPSMFELADVAIYVAILAELGLGDDPARAHFSQGALTVTTNLNINFLRKPEAVDLIADARLMKLGRRLCVGEVWLRSEGRDEPVAHATATYSVPPA